MADDGNSCDEFEESDDVDLGFAEKCEDTIYLSSLFFPSKLGGRPAWLRLDSLPANDKLVCGNCEKRLLFLCQVYVPNDLKAEPNDNTQLYHRMVYLFCCRNGPCSKYNSFIKSFRTQRLQTDADELNEKDKNKLNDLLKDVEKQQSLCTLCGCLGTKTCSSCHKVSYCCKDHQAIDWKYHHKKECNNSADTTDSPGKHPLLFDEYEIVIEAEPPEQVNKASTTNEHDKLCDDATKLDKQLEEDLAKLKEEKVDEYFSNFRERIDREPDQIIRYDLGGPPLWVSNENIPSDDEIPNCICGSKRQFEFQVLPQMLNYLGVETTLDSIDWGTLCVYTCVQNCNDGNAYKEEFVWKQDVSQCHIKK